MTALLGATIRRDIPVRPRSLIGRRTALAFADTARLTDRTVSAHHRENQDWV
ncbi:hypothetical protein [Streptomyces sp. NPDC048611]|uniref:hypothetical protein n=1 Tax=Streptomyces sp. NPDC048611 TaxID=3155635 RepID=UPI00343BD1E6